MRIPEPGWMQGDDVARGLVPEPPENWLPAEDRNVLESEMEIARESVERIEGERLEAVGDVLETESVAFTGESEWPLDRTAKARSDAANALRRLADAQKAAVAALRDFADECENAVADGDDGEGE